MKVSVLTSSSSANSIVVQANGHWFLIEAGLSPRAASALLHKHDLRLANMHAVLVSHAHGDHFRYIHDYERRGIHGGIGPAGVSFLDGRVDCRAFAVAHDAPGGTYGFHIVERETNAALAIIMDAGSFNKDMRDAINASDCVVIGADYDAELEGNGNYEASLQSRISSATGHMSNQQIQEFIRQDWNGRAHTFILAHLSPRRNNPELAARRVLEACDPMHVPKIIVSTPAGPTPLISVNP